MKITLSTTEIKAHLPIVIGVVEKKQTLPILSHILFTLKDKQLTLRATDMEIEIKTQFAIESTAEIRFTVYAKTLFDIMRNLNDNTTIDLIINQENIILKTGSGKFTLNSLATENFPELPQISDQHSLVFNKENLKTLIEKTAFSIANQDIRSYLNGLLIKLSKDNLTLAATDGHKLAIATEKHKNNLKEDKVIIIPKKTVLELQKLLASEYCGDEIKVIISEHYFTVNLDDQIILTSRLIDAQFPNYEQVIPSDLSSPIKIERLSFLSCLHQAAVFIDERTKGVKLIFDGTNLAVTTHSEKGQANTVLKLTTAVNAKFEAGFNINYLINVLERLSSSEINFIMPDINKSCLLTNSDSDIIKYIIMPLKL